MLAAWPMQGRTRVAELASQFAIDESCAPHTAAGAATFLLTAHSATGGRES